MEEVDLSSLFCVDWSVLQLPQPNYTVVRLSMRDTLLDDETFERIIRVLPALQSLDVANCVWLTDRSVRTICAHLPHLKHLTLSGCVRITGHAVKALAEHYTTRLCTLELAWLHLYTTDLRHILRYGSSLTRLDLSGCRHCSALPDILRTCRNLCDISLAHCTVDDDLIRTLVSQLSHVRELNINQSEAPPLTFTTLTVLNFPLSYSFFLSFTLILLHPSSPSPLIFLSYQTLVGRYSDLQSIGLSGQLNVDDSIVDTLLRTATSLTSLDISYTRNKMKINLNSLHDD